MKPKYLIEYALLRAIAFVLRLFPWSAAIRLGEYLGVLLSVLLSKRKKLILENLAKAFPENSIRENKRIAASVWKNLGRNAAEFVCLPRLAVDNIDRLITWKGVEHMENALKQDKGVVLVASHFGNWEIGGWATQYRFGGLLAIARPMKNPLVERWVQARRTEGGNRIALHRDAVRATLKWLKTKGIAGILADQNLYTGGVFVDFFGRPAATTTLPTLLHERTDCPVLFTYTLRDKNKFIVCYDEAFHFPEDSDKNQKLLKGTQLISDHLENLVKKYPENWFWIHNRWKRQP